MIMQRIKNATEPTTEPISLTELKVQLRINSSAEDAALTSLISAARMTLEQVTKRTIARATFQMFMDRWPCGGADAWWDGTRQGSIRELVGDSNELSIPAPPLVSVESIKTYTDADVATTMSASDYYVDTKSLDQLGRVALRTGASWPIALRTRNGIEVNYTAGYADGSVPAALKLAVLNTAAWAYNNRGDCDAACEDCGAMTLADRYIVRGTR